jgi:predicted TIM-barrel fold metal-dependent hydrolase
VTYQQDQYLEPIVPLIGEDNIIWGADYPHPGLHLAKLARDPGAEPRRVLVEHVQKKIVHDNVVRLYGLN